MINLLLYGLVVLVWGSSWLAIKYQLGVVPPEVSVIYRFCIAGCVMLAWVALLRLPMRFTRRDHLFIALQGALIFCINYTLFYHAAAYLTTGLIAVVMSTAPIMTMLINAVIWRHGPSLQMLFGAVLGAVGIAMIFQPELAGFLKGEGGIIGVVLSLAATACFSAGGIVSARNQAAGLSVRGSTAWAMLYGVTLLIVFAIARQSEVTFDPRPLYVGSLVFLAIVSTVIGFACYFALIGRIGTERSAYSTVLFPVVALTISTVFEDYTWSVLALIGVAFTLCGNVLVLTSKRRSPSTHGGASG